ncbi:MAG: dsDNA nuclease domain-containing protein [Clostridiaceae bacterium]|nr:dsDNA nuclease domain-containing protein [Clostridiaceae bacterium]
MLVDTYSTIPYDLSGSMSKNRFRQELFWGVSRMFDLFDRDNFCVIFDYKCDVEVHFSDSIEFFQIKTHKVQSPFKFTALKKIDGNQSIIAKLFLLKDASSPELPIRCTLVSNTFFQINRTPMANVETFCFTELDATSQRKVKQALQDELQRGEVDLNNLHYIYTSMNLLNPQDDLKGKIIGSFERIKGCEPVKPNALYRLIADTVQERACYELIAFNYDELVNRKGMTKTELNSMLDRYIEKSDDSVDQVLTLIDQRQVSAREKKNLKAALTKIVELEYKAMELQRKEQEISEYIEEKIADETFEQIADILLEQFGSTFPIDYTYQEKYIFMLLIAKRWEGGKYE